MINPAGSVACSPCQPMYLLAEVLLAEVLLGGVLPFEVLLVA